MPKLKKETYVLHQDDGEETVAVHYNVDNTGLFTAQVPDVLEGVLRATLRGDDCDDVIRREKVWGDIELSRPRIHLRLEGTNLNAIESLITKAVEDYNRPEISEELIILYCYSGEGSIWRTPTGELVPNGVSARRAAKKDGAKFDGERYGNWLETGNTSATRPAHGGYSVRFGARGGLKVTTRRGAMVKHEYKWHGLGLADDHPISLLNEFCSFSLPVPGSRNAFGLSIQEIPYTADAAHFFYGMMMQIASMHAQMHEFFNNSDPEQMLDRIRNGLGVRSALALEDSSEQQ